MLRGLCKQLLSSVMRCMGSWATVILPAGTTYGLTNEGWGLL